MSTSPSHSPTRPRAGLPWRRLLGAVALVALLAVFWRPLVNWFAGKPMGAADTGSHPAAHAHGDAPASGSSPAAGLPPQASNHVRHALTQYDAARGLLAHDRMEGLIAHTRELQQALEAARAAVGAGHPAAALLERSHQEAGALGASENIDVARTRFATLSSSMLGIVQSEPSLRQAIHVFQCPMVKGFNQWLQLDPKLENPYMGQRMAACGTEAKLAAVSSPPKEGIAYYTCPMHPSVKKHEPSTCPICGMDLTPVTHEEVSSGIIRVDETRAQRIGITTAQVVSAPMDLSFTALGRVTFDETALQEVTLKLDGYIQELRVAATGQPVKKGEVLFTLYSPELYAAQNEYLLARSSQSAANASLVRAARKRLELWGMTSGQIDRIAQKGEAQENMPFLSPASGFVLEKNVVEGAAVKAGERLFRIAPLDKVWVEASVFEQDLAKVKVGQPVQVKLRHLPGRTFEGRVGYIYPSLEEKTRTGKIRVELPNTGLELKPDMYADVIFEQKGEPRLQIPEEAVLYTGPRRLVFVDLGEGRMKPQEVKLGLAGDGTYEVLEGLKEGDRVVTSGNFLVAAESRLRSANDTSGGAADAQPASGGAGHGAH